MIPNICHFVFGLQPQKEEFLFCYFLAVYSSYIVNNPDVIYFYYHYEPFGKWWDEMKKIQTIKLEKVELPTHFGQKIIVKTAHKADKVRMDKLYERGGIYLDIDTICVRPWKDLLNNNVVLGIQHPTYICNAIMFTEAKSHFFKIWFDNYDAHFNPSGWCEASVHLPAKLAKSNPGLLTLKNADVFFLPNYDETDKIFVLKNEISENLISLHVWETFSLKYLKNIKDWSWARDNSHTLYGKIMLELLNKI